MRNFTRRPGAVLAVVQFLRARRALVPFLGVALYVVAIGFRVDHGVGARPWLLGALSLAGAYVAAGPTLPGNGLRDDGRRAVGLFAYALAGFAVVVGSLDSVARDLLQDACGGAAAFVASVTAARAMSRAEGGHGVADSLPRAPQRLFAMTIVVLVSAFGFALLASARALRDATPSVEGPLSRDAHAIAAGGGLLVLFAFAWETLRWRRLVLGAGDRLLTSLGVVLAFAGVAGGLLILGDAAADRVLRLMLAGAALSVTYVTTAGDAAVLARRGRRAVALLVFGGPIVLLGGLAAEGPGRSTSALLVTGVVALFVGSAVAYLEQPFRRAEGQLLDALDAANQALVRADPDTSIRDALGALRTFRGVASQSPELWTLVPMRVLTIDGAGYTCARDAVLPETLLEVAKEEPEATVRTELLEALVVRRPDLRPLTRWMDERDALSATLVTRDGEVDGVLIVPRGGRRTTMALEEVRAVKRLADAFAGASAAEAALARSLAREQVATERGDRAIARVSVHERDATMWTERDRVLTARRAEAAHGGPYAPVSRFAFEAIGRRMERGAALVMTAPHGADVVAYLARAHLAGPRKGRAFHVVEGAALAEQPLRRWIDPDASPLVLANHGLLVLDEATRLPAEVQALLAQAMTDKRWPWLHPEGESPLDVTLAVVARHRDEPGLLSFEGAFAAMLVDALADVIAWPPLRERGEDLRSLVQACLAREGMSLRGTPLGIEDAAYERLTEYAFPGEDRELRAILASLARVAEGDVVRVGDLGKAGLPRELGGEARL